MGWQRILQPGLHGLRVSGNPPVREGNGVRIHIDGAEALPAMQRAMMGAWSHIYLANWTDRTAGQLGTLLEADHDNRLFASTIYSRVGPQSRAVYVHAKRRAMEA